MVCISSFFIVVYKRFLFIGILILFSNILFAQQSGTVGKLSDLDTPTSQLSKATKDITENVGKADQEFGKRMISSIQNLKTVISRSSTKLKEANKVYKENYSKESAKMLLKKLSSTYNDLLNAFQQVPMGFVEKSQDFLENTIIGGESVAEKSILENRKNMEFKKKLIRNRIALLSKLKAEITSEVDFKSNNEIVRTERDVKRLHRLIQKHESSVKRMTKINQRMSIVAGRFKKKLESMQTTILAFNQLNDEFKYSKSVLDDLVLLSELNDLDVGDFNDAVGSLFVVGTALTTVTDEAFDNILEGPLLDGPDITQRDHGLSVSGAIDPLSSSQDLNSIIKIYQ